MQTAEQPIEVARSTLGGLLAIDRLAIPNFQREYSWKPSRVRKLFDDFHNALAVRHLPSYFLGSIVLTPGKPPAIIDGQQRLATTTIFLAAVRDAFLRLRQKKDAKKTEDQFLLTWDRDQREDMPRLTMNTDDRAYMNARVLVRPEDRKENPVARLHSHRLIDKAATIAAERVEQIIGAAGSTTRKVEALNAWIDYIHYNTVIALLTAPSTARAYQMYKTMNDRAQRTTPADMIKNHLFEQAEDHVDEAQSKWSTMRSLIEGVFSPGGDDPLLTYLHHVSILFHGPIQEDDIFDLMEDKVKGRGNSLRFLEALANYANDYAAVLTPSHAKWIKYDQRIRTYVKHVSLEIRMSFIRPLMLAIASHFSPAENHRAFRLLVSWVVRFLIAGGSRSGVVEKAFGDAAHAIAEGRITTARDLARAVVNVVPTDTKFHAAFCTKSLSSSRQVRFILRELEAEERGENPESLLGAVEDTAKITLEHILPKNLSAATGWDHFSDEERRAYRWRLGNLVLLNAKDNSVIGDKPFSVKRPAIQQS